MRILIAIAAALTLAACATPAPAPPATLAPAPGRAAVVAAATLSWGPFEDLLAPAYTRNAVVRQRAARALDAGRISVEQARQVLHHTDAARADLDAARESRARWRIDRAHDEMWRAEEAMK